MHLMHLMVIQTVSSLCRVEGSLMAKAPGCDPGEWVRFPPSPHIFGAVAQVVRASP